MNRLNLVCPPYFEQNRYQRTGLWFGPRGSGLHLHGDAYDNFICQLVGEKTIWLFPHQDRRHLYPRDQDEDYWWSEVDPEKLDYEKFPLYRKASPFRVTLSPGQMIYIPSGWGHLTRNQNASLMVCFFMHQPRLKWNQDFRAKMYNRISRSRASITDRSPLTVRTKNRSAEAVKKPQDILRVVNPSKRDFMRQFGLRGRPAIILKSPVFESCCLDLDTIVEKLGNLDLNFWWGNYVSESNRRKNFKSPIRDFTNRYIKRKFRCEGQPPPYAHGIVLSTKLINGIGLTCPPYFEESRYEKARMWYGPRGSGIKLHCDSIDNFICQLVGEKTLWLFPPEDHRYLYPRDRIPKGYWWSEINPENVDYEEFPLYRKTSPFRVTLCPGQMLYLPHGWSHFIRNQKTSLMIHFRMFRPRLQWNQDFRMKALNRISRLKS